jgi:hypothetical protein
VAHYERVLQLDQQTAADAAPQHLERLTLQQQGQQQQQQQQQGDAQQDDMQLDVEEQQQQAEQQQHGATQDLQQQKQQTTRLQQQQQTADQQRLQQLGRGLVREAAHNLCMIYRGSGADDLARQVMRKYLTL